jgi:hypothetical protein
MVLGGSVGKQPYYHEPVWLNHDDQKVRCKNVLSTYDKFIDT